MLTNTTGMESKAKLIYIGDPMCSWCYGFADEITSAKAQLEEKVDFEMVMGGLRPYSTEPIKQMKSFLKDHWSHVYEKSNQPFSYEILDADSIVYDTEPPCRAVVTIRELSPENEFDYFKAVQKAFYAENKNPNLTKTYRELAVEFGVDSAEFEGKFTSGEMVTRVREDFDRSAEMGIGGFPSVILQVHGKRIFIAHGYTTAKDIVEKVNKALN
ncbi:MAG: DsbA family protein [Flavobacteriales bacterium]|nr:DsbA family protein [Flavobacteriales bacterium]